MNIQSRTTTFIIASSLALAACQSTPSSITNSKGQNTSPRVLIEPLPDADNDGVPDEVDNCPNTPKNIEVNPYGCPLSVNLMGVLMMELRAFFDTGSDELKDKYLLEVEKVAEKLRDYPEQVVVISGYTSTLETAQSAKFFAKNKAHKNGNPLGRRRAQTIKNILTARNIASNRIYTFDCADGMPIAPSDTEEGRLMNQRVYSISMPADKFYKDKGYENRDSYAYYNRMCEQF